ncbi:MAG: endolytic transglycosylase MltG [bacterium]
MTEPSNHAAVQTRSIPRSRRRRIAAWAVLLALGLVTGGGAGAYGWVERWLDRPTRAGAPTQVFAARKGRSVGQIARDLAAAGLVSHPRLFALVARHQNVDTRIHSGEYELSANLTPRQILRRLAEGNVLQVWVTLPEGLTRREVAHAIAATGLADEQELLRATADARLVAGVDPESADLEGYLFPDTYRFPRGITTDAIVRTLVERFRQVAGEVLTPHLARRGLTLRQAVTLASIVEKETGQRAERPLIAAVFLNRLARGMRLESDPTVIYGIPDFDGNLTRAHLRAATPYNTYVIPGLPAGPIANPGAESLAAIATPAEVPYLFFVAKGDGTHQFSETLVDHERAVRKYQLGQAGSR